MANAAEVTVTHLSTGRYSCAVTLPTLAGQRVEIFIAATVGGVNGGGVVFADMADSDAADPLANLVPGTYEEGTAGYALGTELENLSGQIGALGGLPITVVSPVSAAGNITIVRGDCYHAAEARALTRTSTGWVNLSGWTLELVLQDQTFPATFTAVGGSQTVSVDLAVADTLGLTAGGSSFVVRAFKTSGGAVTHDISLWTGIAAIYPEIS